MAKRTLKLETPGEVAPEPTPEMPDAPDESPPAAPVDAPKGEMSAAQDATLKTALVQTAKLVGAKGALDWSHLNAAAAVKTDYVAIDAALPGEDTAFEQANSSGQPVLSRAGWVLPKDDPRARFGGR